jgi:hypothetical protein
MKYLCNLIPARSLAEKRYVRAHIRSIFKVCFSKIVNKKNVDSEIMSQEIL